MLQPRYEIEETKKKLFLTTLEPGRRYLAPGDRVHVTVDGKRGKLVFGRRALDAMNMQKAWIRLSYDATSEVVAWRVRNELSNEHLEEKGWKFAQGNKSNGVWTIQIKRILDTFQHVEAKTYKSLEVKKFQEKGSMIDPDVYYFVELKSV